jgi:hypothetical protein
MHHMSDSGCAVNLFVSLGWTTEGAHSELSITHATRQPGCLVQMSLKDIIFRRTKKSSSLPSQNQKWVKLPVQILSVLIKLGMQFLLTQKHYWNLQDLTWDWTTLFSDLKIWRFKDFAQQLVWCFFVLYPLLAICFQICLICNEQFRNRGHLKSRHYVWRAVQVCNYTHKKEVHKGLKGTQD